MKQSKLWTKDFTSLCLSALFLFMTFYSLMTALPFFILEDLHQPEESVGLATTTYLIAAVIIRPFAGKWLETYSRKKIIFISLFGMILLSGFYLIINSYEMLLTLRFIQGLGFGVATTATGAIAADIVPKERRGEGIGFYSMFMTIAMVFGPFLSLTIIQQSSFNVLFIAVIIFAVLSFVFGLMINIPSILNNHDKANTKAKKFSIHDYFEIHSVPIAIAAAVFGIAYSSLLSYVPLFAAEIGIYSIASFFFIVFAVVIILTRPYTGKWFDLYGGNKIIYPALCLFMVGFLLLSVTQGATLYFVSAVIIALGYGATMPSYQTIAIQSAPPHRSGMATATFFLLFDLGFGVGSSLNGILAAKASYSFMFQICALMTVISGILYFLLCHRKVMKRTPEQKHVNV
ncbi:MAG: MFS transporter [Bacillus sp. (in: firmicutes)]